MAQTNQIFAPQVYAQAPKINPAIFAQAVPSFKPLDLTTILEAEKMEYLKQKMAIDAQKNMIDLEEAKARLKIAENAIIEKRKAENKAVIKMYADQMDLKGNEQNESWRSDASKALFIEKNGEFNKLIAEAPDLDKEEIAARANAWQTKWGTHRKHSELIQQDEYVKSLIKDSERANSPINKTLLRDFIAKHQKNQINPLTVDPTSLMVDTDYMEDKLGKFSKAIAGKYVEKVLAPDKQGGFHWITTQKMEAPQSKIMGEAYAAITSDPTYMKYLENAARAESIIKGGMPSAITDINKRVEELATADALSFATTAVPDIDWTDMTKVVAIKQRLAQESKPGGGAAGGTIYINKDTPTGEFVMGQETNKGNADANIDVRNSRIAGGYAAIGNIIGKDYSGMGSKTTASAINNKFPGAATEIDRVSLEEKPKVEGDEYMVLVNGNEYLASDVRNFKTKSEKAIKGSISNYEAVSSYKFYEEAGSVYTVKPTNSKDKAYIVKASSYSKDKLNTVNGIKNGKKAGVDYYELTYTPKKTGSSKPKANTRSTQQSTGSNKGKGKLDDKY